jgi:RIP metalloprotease RseP
MLTTLYTYVWPIFLIIFFFGGSIFVHEYGHFLAARKRGLKVERFSIGFGPKICSWVKDGVEYRLSLLPLGGYVALPQLGSMEGIEGTYKGAPLPPISYLDKVIVVSMGAIFNVIFAFVLATILWVTGIPTAPQEKTTTIGYVASQVCINKDTLTEGPAYKAGLKPGDEVLAIDGKPVDSFSDIRKYIALGAGRTQDHSPQATVRILREGQEQTVILEPALCEMNSASQDRIRLLGIEPAAKLKIGAVLPGSPAQRSGLKTGDTLLSANGEPLYALHSLADLLQQEPETPVKLEVLREHSKLILDLVPQLVPYTKPLLCLETDEGESLSFLPYTGEASSNEPLSSLLSSVSLMVYEASEGLKPTQTGDSLLALEEALSSLAPGEPLTLTLQSSQAATYTLKLSLVQFSKIEPRTQALIGIELDPTPMITHENPFKQITKTITMTYQTLSSLVHRKTDIELKHLMGPPGIMRTFHSFSNRDIRLALWFTLVLNINLAIFNLLPIPVLDGGHLLFATLGKIFKKDIPATLIAKIQGAFMVLLFSLMLYASFFDMCRWRGERQEDKAFQKEKLLYLPPEFDPRA